VGLLDILDCTMNDLVGPVAAARSARNTAAGGAEDATGIGARRPKRARITGAQQ